MNLLNSNAIQARPVDIDTRKSMSFLPHFTKWLEFLKRKEGENGKDSFFGRIQRSEAEQRGQ